MTQQHIGTLLIDKIPPQVTDTFLYSFFNNFADVSSVIITHNENNESTGRYCWVDVEKTAATVRLMKRLWPEQDKLNIRIMGQRYPSIPLKQEPNNTIFMQ